MTYDPNTVPVNIELYTALWRAAWHLINASTADCAQSHDNLLRHALDAARDAERLHKAGRIAA